MKQSPMYHGGNWTAEDIQKLQEIVDQFKGGDVQKEVDWDWVVTQFGPSKTRFDPGSSLHQDALLTLMGIIGIRF